MEFDITSFSCDSEMLTMNFVVNIVFAMVFVIFVPNANSYFLQARQRSKGYGLSEDEHKCTPGLHIAANDPLINRHLVHDHRGYIIQNKMLRRSRNCYYLKFSIQNLELFLSRLELELFAIKDPLLVGTVTNMYYSRCLDTLGQYGVPSDVKLRECFETHNLKNQFFAMSKDGQIIWHGHPFDLPKVDNEMYETPKQLCLDYKGSFDQSDRTEPTFYPCHGLKANQFFVYLPSWQIYHPESKKCLSVIDHENTMMAQCSPYDIKQKWRWEMELVNKKKIARGFEDLDRANQTGVYGYYK